MLALCISTLASLAAVLLLSGITKLAAPASGRSLLGTAAVPAVLSAPWLTAVLPWAETALAAALLLTSGPWLSAAAAAAALLFAGFTVVVLRGTRAPDPASCGCFGVLSTAPVSWRTVVRNAAFTLTAVLALVLSLTGFHGPVLALPASVLAAAAVPVVLALVTLWSEGAGRSPAGAHDVARVPPLPAHLRGGGAAASSSPGAAEPGSAERGSRAAPGSHPSPESTEERTEELDYERLPIPWAGLQDAVGNAVTLRGLAATRARALVAVSSTCGWCAPVLDRLTALGDGAGPVALHAVVSQRQELERIPEVLRETALLDAHGDLSAVFEHPGTPWAVVLGADGLLAGGPAAGAGPVLELLEELAERFGA